MTTPQLLLRRAPPTWLVVTLYIIIAPVFILRWDYGRFSDFSVGFMLGMVTAWWLIAQWSTDGAQSK